ncbi:MAG TPA: phosphoribosylaminoimidazolesuccinocarboxamide synthase [Spirochaetota bacterium]
MEVALIQTEIPGAKKLFSGKVRDVYEVDDKHLVIVSTDRISAFDYVFPNGIPGKGIILNKITNFWFSKLDFIKNHIVETDYTKFPKPFSDAHFLKDRAVLVKKVQKLDFECIARGYIIGSGWKDYQMTGAICGIRLPAGLILAEELPEPIFTPSTKAEVGHDENISFDAMIDEYGAKDAESIKNRTLQIYKFACAYLKKCGIILADTKLEFGFLDGEIILIDEVLTPDSSRFWDMSKYKVGASPVSFDKQYIRDYLDTTSWDKNSPAPALPDEIIEKTLEKYDEILKRLTQTL